jgi:hypothetical protein
MQLHRTILSNVVQKRRKNKVALVLVNFEFWVRPIFTICMNTK